MPTYEYKCEDCRYQFDAFQSIVDPPLKKCPKCGKGKVVRLIGKGGGIIFKGEGWPGQDISRKGQKDNTNEEN